MKTPTAGEDIRNAKEPDSRDCGAAPKERSSVFDLLLVAVLVFVFMFGVVRPFVAEAFRIPSESMAPTLEAGDRVLVNKFAYRFTGPERGDVILFQDMQDRATIKRVIGLPGDSISVWDGVLRVNGEPRRESYVDYELTDSTFFGPEEIPAGYVFVMGDNRINSEDSRTFGPVPEEDLRGRAFLRLWPPGRADAL